MEVKMDGRLLSHCGTDKVSRDSLATLPVPERTDSFQPIPHNVFIDSIEESLAYRHMRIERSEFAVSKDGMKMFGLLEVNAEYEGVRFAIGCRNANDKSMRLGMVAGYRVFVCDNMALSGDFRPLLAKHTKNFDLIEAVSMGVDRIHRGWEPLKEEIQRKRKTLLPADQAKLLIYNAFTRHRMPVSLFKTVATAYESSQDETTLWSLENHFTEAFKKLTPIAQYQASAKLPKALQYDGSLAP
jgi:hypothetical protein